MDNKEDQKALVDEQEVRDATTSDHCIKFNVVKKVLDSLNEKRDSYYGIVTSIIYIIDSQDTNLITAFKTGLIDLITCRPMRYGGKIFLSKAIARLSSERPLFILDVFEQIIESTSDWSKNFFQDGSEILRIQIIALKAIKQSEQSRGGRATRIDQIKIEKLCADAILLCDDSTKVDTLSIVLESRSTTKPLENNEFSLFKILFHDALSFQEPALRQIFIASTNKLIKRLKASHTVVTKDTKKYSSEQRDTIRSRYLEFLKWLIETCFDSIYCNAYFGSFILTISTLKLVIQHITFSDEHLLIESFFNNRRCYDSILSCLNDSFEENKLLAMELLFSLPCNTQFDNAYNLKCFNDIAYQLVGSVNPAHSLTCQYVFKLIVGLQLKQADCQKTRNQLLLEHLTRLVDIVEEGVKDTREDFVEALKHKPIYPKLSVIRALLGEIDFRELDSDRNEWKLLAKRIVTSSIEACRTVSNIVCNLNPETIGHLPMDLKPVDVDTLTKTLNVSLSISAEKLNTITSQMLLICGWKTIKECSLSLGSMCVRFWWPKERIKTRGEKFPGLDTEPILDNDDIVKILEFFDHYLKNLRHRGAFEQAYNGFIMVTRRAWHDEQLRDVLVKTLNGIMIDFRNDALDVKKKECLKAYVTRRSAGLPFIVQAILNSEHKHDSKTLRWVLDCLFEVLESDSSELYQRIHCLNILRALIKEHFLGEKVLSYIGKTFSVTMESFRSNSFPIRNCANMLLKATVDRTFGVNRLRDDIHRKNQLSFERFFTECRDLNKDMLRHLKDGLEDKRCLAAVHAVFIILFRLKPSLKPHNGYISDTIIKPFIDPIVKLAYQCPDYKLRELAAKLVVRLESFCCPNDENLDYSKQGQYYLTYLNDFLFNISPLTIDRNRLHGALLIIKNWIDDVHSNLSVAQTKNFLQFSYRTVLDICLSQTRLDTSILMKTVALDLAESCCLRSVDLAIADQKNWLGPLYDVKCFTKEDSREPYFENLVFKYVTVLLMGFFPPEHMSVECDERISSPCLQQIVDLLLEIVVPQPNQEFGVNLQASLLRFLRQLFARPEGSVEAILEKLDLDLTAAHMSLFDKLKLKSDFDVEREKLIKYCDQTSLKNYLKQSLSSQEMFDFTRYVEFRPLGEGNMNFSSKFSNTPRSIEFLALIYENWEEFDLGKNSIWQKDGESLVDKLRFITCFISSLPECDVKCLALLCAGKVMQANVDRLLTDENQEKSDRIKALEQFCDILDELADGDHNLAIRETCCEVIRLNVKGLVVENSNLLKSCQVSLFSALIKLSQDEEHEVRSLSLKAIVSLIELESERRYSPKALKIGSRSDYLIRLITNKLFNANIPQDVDSCFELLMRIIFNHSKNYSNDVNEAKERLFDKTKLNTFADHVATVRSCLCGLQAFFNSRYEPIELNSLRLPEHVLAEFNVIDKLGEHNTGDYSWRLKKVADNLLEHEHPIEQGRNDNNQIMNEFLENLHKSLEYFSKGYDNMLIDTDYTYRELSLYKRVAFVKFILDCTKHNLKEHLVNKVQQTLQTIVEDNCSTTMLYKCIKMLN